VSSSLPRCCLACVRRTQRLQLQPAQLHAVAVRVLMLPPPGVFACHLSSHSDKTIALSELLPVETSAGERIAFVSSATNSLEVKKALTYFEECHKLFQFKDARVVERNKSFVLEAPSTKGLIKIVLLHKIAQATPRTMPDVVFFSPLDASSVTHEGTLRLTEAFIEEPPHGCPPKEIVKTALKNPALAYLDGVHFDEIVQFVNRKWSPLLYYDVDSPPEKLGLVVDPGVVRVVKLKFGDESVPIILRQDPEEPLSSAMEKSCDWRAWPAVNALDDSGEIKEDEGVISVPGESMQVSLQA
jgi:hypothetical protein